MSPLLLLVLSVTVGILAVLIYLGVVAKARTLFNDRSKQWQAAVDDCSDELKGTRAAYVDVGSRTLQLNEFVRCTLLRKEPLDRAVDLIGRGKHLLLESRLSHLWLPDRLVKKFPSLKDPDDDSNLLQTKLNQLIAARMRALEPVDGALRSHLPDLREQLAALPIQASTLAIGVLTLVGFIWLCGYYSVLGIAFLPLLRDVDDIALVGLTSGVVPLAAFASMVAASLIRIESARSAARSYSKAIVLARALATARDVRRIRFWAWRTIACLTLLLLIAVTAAATLKLRLEYNVSFEDSKQVSKAALVGSIGDFILLSEETRSPARARRIIAMPRDRLRCLRSGGLDGPEHEACVDTDELSMPGPMPTQVTVINEDTVRHSWQAYVAREAECWVINPEDQAPLISPVFRDDSGNELDMTYYQSRPAAWPYDRKCDAPNPDQCVAQAMSGPVGKLLAKAVAEQAREPSLHLFSFASSTHFPEHNRELTRERAAHVFNLLKTHVAELTGCEIAAHHHRPGQPRGGCPVTVHTHAMGQMPDFLWAGVQGDASRRVVMAAVCRANIH